MKSIAIKVNELSYSYPLNNQTDRHEAANLKKVLKKISFEVEDGEKISIIGPNGAGKSTLLLNIAGLSGEEYREGNIYIYDMKVDKKNIFNIREKIGFVFQDPNDQLFSLKVFDDVAFGLMNLLNKNKDKRIKDKEYIKEIVSLSLKKVNAEGLEERIPHFLSFGEKKLTALATVLSYSPKLLIFDEPSSNLDPVNRRDLIELIKEMKETVIIATHDLDMAYEISERFIILNKGEIVFDGKNKDILKNREFLLSNGLDLPLMFSNSN